MGLLTAWYDKVLHWSRARYAPQALCAVSFAESSFFPIPPDVMLAPMVLARPHKAWWLALLTTIFSVLGGLFGYFLGMLMTDWVQWFLQYTNQLELFEDALLLFAKYGIWLLLAAGFSPIPYKIFTIAAGVFAMPLLPFVLISLVGRGMRFFLVAALLRWGGIHYQQQLRTIIDRAGWLLVLLLLVLAGIYMILR